jgi:hypothetical protein
MPVVFYLRTFGNGKALAIENVDDLLPDQRNRMAAAQQ